MPIFRNNRTEARTAINVHFAGNLLIVTLDNGSLLRVPLEDIGWLHWLLDATPTQRAKWTLEPGGFAVYWEELDDGFEIEHLLKMPDINIQTNVAEQQYILA